VSAAQRDVGLAQVEGETSPKSKFKAYPIGYFHIDIAEVRTAKGNTNSAAPAIKAALDAGEPVWAHAFAQNDVDHRLT
jgi:hypothetical protein